ASRLGSDPIEPQAREVEFLNKGVDRPNRIALIDPVLQALGKQRRLPAIDPLNEAPHLIPPQIAAESYSANQIIQCVFTQLGSGADITHDLANVRFTPHGVGTRTLPQTDCVHPSRPPLHGSRLCGRSSSLKFSRPNFALPADLELL